MLNFKTDKFRIRISVTLVVFVAVMVGLCAVFGLLSYNNVEKQYESLYISNVTSVRDDALGDVSGTARTKEDFSSAIAHVHKYDFEHVYVVSMDGSLICTSAETAAPDFVNSLGSEAIEAFSNKDGATCSVTVDGVTTLYVFAPYNEVSSERYIASMPFTEHRATMTNQLLITVFQCLTMIIATFVCGIALSLTFKNRNNVLPRVKPVKNFFLTVSSNGTILAANKLFTDNFDVKNVSSGYQQENGVSFYVALTEGYPIVCNLTDKKGDLKRLVFSAVTSKLGYKLIGSDMSPILTQFDDMSVAIRKNSKTGLWNETELENKWKELIKSGNFKNCAVAQLCVNNLEYFRMLFGDANIVAGIRVFIDKLAENLKEYGELYSLNSGNIAFFITSKDKREKFVKNLPLISEKATKPITIEGNLIQIDASIGVVMLDNAEADTEFETIMLSCGHALKNANENPQTPYYVMRTAVFESPKHDLSTKEGVREVIASGHADVWFQPQYNIVENKVVGFESLFRIVGEGAKTINVFDFIAAAERNGLIVELGKFIYNRAMDFAVSMQEFGVTVSINVSPIQLMQVGFVESFMKTYNEKHLKPGSVDVEIVESSIIYSLNEVVRKLTVLKKNGIGTHIDDFGVAYSSMLYLKSLPVSTLKIDKAFIDGITESKESYAIVKNIVNICSDLNLGCIAEGVETDEQVAQLKKMGCSVIQGFWMSGAMPREKAYEFIKEKNK